MVRKPLRVVVETAAETDYAPKIALTGEVSARVSSELSFRVSGRVVDRRVEIGEHVTPDQVIATLDPEEQKASLAAAQADVDSAAAKVRQSASTLDRQKELIARGFTTRRDYDQAEQDYRVATGSLDGAKAQLGTARDQLDQTTLKAGAAGTITGRSIEAGQVVQSAQVAYTLALDGPRDAVFNVYESIFIHKPTDGLIKVALVSAPAIESKARIREVSPVVDTSGGTVRVKFDIIDPPAAMSLGAAVTGTGEFAPERRIVLSWNVMASQDGKPAVWLVDPKTNAVSLRPVAIESYEFERVVIRDGLKAGDVVVSSGQQLLHPDQIVDPTKARPS